MLFDVRKELSFTVQSENKLQMFTALDFVNITRNYMKLKCE
jgi:hypothetical protein